MGKKLFPRTVSYLLLLGLLLTGMGLASAQQPVSSGVLAHAGNVPRDGFGQPHINYSDAAAGELRYTRGSNPPPPPPPPSPTPVPCYWDTFIFGVDSWITAAPNGSILATFAYAGQTYPALVAVEYGAGRAVYAEGSTFSGIENVTNPGGAKHMIFLNSVAWVTHNKPPAESRVLVTWGHREILTYHHNGQCCSTHIPQALMDAGYTVDISFDVPASLAGYDAVIMPGVGWIWTLGYPDPPYWSGDSGHAPTTDEVATLLAFVQNGGGLVTSVEWNLGASWMNPIGNPMGVTFDAISNASPLVGNRTVDHPIFQKECPGVTPTPTLPPPSPSPTSTPLPRPSPRPTLPPPPPPPPPPGGCNLYPIALHWDTVRGAKPGDLLKDILNGTRPGNFGWLTWTGDQSINALVRSLTPPGDSYTYINPDDPQDHTVSPGDWVYGRPGVADSRRVRAALDALKPLVITVPVWDQATGHPLNRLRYRVVGFAQIQIADYHLPGQNRISAFFWGWMECEPQQALWKPAPKSADVR